MLTLRGTQEPSPLHVLRGWKGIAMIRKRTFPEGYFIDLTVDVDEIDLIQKAIDAFKSGTHACPVCGTIGCRVVNTYFRTVITIRYGKRKKTHVYIPLCECEGCGNYLHALLFDILVPYSQFTLRFILTVLDEYLNKDRSPLEVCEHWQISIKTLYRWAKRFREHFNEVADAHHQIVADKTSAGPRPGFRHIRYYRALRERMAEALTSMIGIADLASYFFDKTRIHSLLQPNHKAHSKPLPRKRR